MVLFDNLRRSVHKALDSESSGHDYAHVMRVFKNAIFIAQSEQGVDMDVLKPAVLLHDIAYSQKFIEGDYSAESKRIASRHLSRKTFSKEQIDRILFAIEHHTIWLKSDPNVPIEVKILRDADRLDHLGYTGIVRAIAYAAAANKRYIDTIYNWLQLDGTFETDQGRKLSKARIKSMRRFVKKLEAEY